MNYFKSKVVENIERNGRDFAVLENGPEELFVEWPDYSTANLLEVKGLERNEIENELMQ